MRMLDFTKMHGLGNDYVFLDCFARGLEGVDAPELARAMSDRHRGVGADGLILMLPPDDPAAADARMEMYNADGSRGEMCGNGIRCMAKYLVEHGLVSAPAADAVDLRIQTDRGVLALRAFREGGAVARVRVCMGEPILRPADIPMAIGGDRCVGVELPGSRGRRRMTCVSMGNPHAVVFADSLDAVDLAAVGPRVERDRLFPHRVNVHVAALRSRREVSMRSWERGSGLTQACGTGACAVLVAGVLEDRLDRAAVVHLPGGDLEIEWPAAGGAPVFMTGPAVEVFSGRWGIGGALARGQ